MKRSSVVATALAVALAIAPASLAEDAESGATPRGGAFDYYTRTVSFGDTPIPDNNPSGYTAVVGNGLHPQPWYDYAISDLNVYVEIDHTWVGDLSITITHGDTTVTLLDRPGYPAVENGCGLDDIEVTFDDEAASTAEDTCGTLFGAITGPKRPTSPLSAFDGDVANGNWYVKVVDNVFGDLGKLVEVEIQFGHEVCAGLPVTIIGTAGDDTLTGTAGDDVIAGLAGNDNIFGLGGNDTICGGPGKDFIDGGPGDNSILGQGGKDTVAYSSASGPVVVDLGQKKATWAGGKDLIKSVENVLGSNFDDRLSGNLKGNTIWGGLGNDDLTGRGGKDKLLGEQGDDTLDGGSGDDRLLGGPGTDSADGGPDSDTCKAEVEIKCEA